LIRLPGDASLLYKKWDTAEAYEPFVGRWSHLVAPRFLLWSRAKHGGDFLEVGCGTGALSQAIVDYGARKLVGIDASPAYVHYASSRVRKNSPDVAFELGNAMALRSPDDLFDAAVAGLVLNFVPDPLSAVREMLRVTKRKGVVAAYVWDYADQMQVIRSFWDAAMELHLEEAYESDEGRRFVMCKPEPLARPFEDAGLKDVETTFMDQRAYFTDFEDYWRPFLGGQAPAPAYAISLRDIERRKLRDYLKSTLPLREDGSLVLNVRAWAVRGAKD
jgi:SAM-dependent methyltransferase